MGTDTNETRLLLLGLPKTGKTTFLAALWHVVESPEVEGSWKLIDLFEGNRDYIERRRQEWLSYREVKRTSPNGNAINLTLKTRQSTVARIEVPDLSGETFRAQFEDRELSRDFAELLDQDSPGRERGSLKRQAVAG